MPDFIVDDDEFNALLNDILKKEIENQSRARSDAVKYLANPNIDIKTLAPIAIVFIIAKLDKEKQVEFIRNNIDYLKEAYIRAKKMANMVERSDFNEGQETNNRDC